jgi:hypothetical protein
MQDKMEFDEWFDIMMNEVKRYGITQVDRATAENDYRLGVTPEHSAEMFAKEPKDFDEPPMMGMSY